MPQSHSKLNRKHFYSEWFRYSFIKKFYISSKCLSLFFTIMYLCFLMYLLHVGLSPANHGRKKMACLVRCWWREFQGLFVWTTRLKQQDHQHSLDLFLFWAEQIFKACVSPGKIYSISDKAMVTVNLWWGTLTLSYCFLFCRRNCPL